MPDTILRLGPDGPDGERWLRAHWGTLQALRHVRVLDAGEDRRRTCTARVVLEFHAADWRPWQALLRARRTGHASCWTSGRTAAVPEDATGPEASVGGAGQGSGDAPWDGWDTPLRAPATPLLPVARVSPLAKLVMDQRRLVARRFLAFGKVDPNGHTNRFPVRLATANRNSISSACCQ